MNENNVIAALFDLDGVVFDTEPQYTLFWKEQNELYKGIKGLEQEIKGQTLVQIYDKYFKDMPDVQDKITNALDKFEKNMTFEYIDGFLEFIKDLRLHGVKTALVTSSNMVKMNAVFERKSDFKQLFDAILTSEDFEKSKPDPDCYLKGAQRLDAEINRCVVFEDSFNGLKSGRAANMKVVGLATTNTENSIKSLCDYVIKDYKNFDFEKIKL